MATKIGVQTITMRQATKYENGVDQGELYPLTASSTGAIALAHVPQESAADILVYLADDDCGTPLDMAGATLTGTTLTIEAAKNQKVIVYYTYESSEDAETYTVDATKFSGTYKLVGNTVLRNSATGKDESFQITIRIIA